MGTDKGAGMILGWLRLGVVALIGLTVVYFVVGIYSRSVRREKLEKRWASDGLEGDRETWIEDGMKAYEHGLKKKLMWLIYIIPMVVFTAAFYIVNYM